jgi:hypothetical protein
MKMLIARYIDTGNQTIGNGFLLSEIDNFIKYEFRTLELPWKNNKRSISCIPCGDYKVIKRTSKKYGNHFHILDVPDRDWILIHNLNFNYQTRGCVGVGDDLAYINDDNDIDITNSKKTLKKLYSLLPDKFDLSIVDR